MKNVFVIERHLDLGRRVALALSGLARVDVHSGSGSPQASGPVDLAFITVDGTVGGAEAFARALIAQATPVIIVAEGPETPIPADLTRAAILINPPDDGEIRNIFKRLTAQKSSTSGMLERAGTWKTVLDQLSEGVILTDAAGAIIYVNDAAERLHGVRKLDTAPDDYTETYHLLTNDGQPHPVETLPLSRAVMSGEIVSSESWRIRRPDGSEVVAVGSARRIYGDAAEMIGAVLTVRDDTERWAGERRLIRSEERFRALADNIPTLCWMANSEGWIFWYNKRWYDYTGTTEDSMRGWGWQAVHDPNILPDVMTRWSASLSSGKHFEMIFPLQGADGTFRPFLTRVTPIYDEAGKVRMWFGTNADITDIRAAQERVAESETRLKNIFDTIPVAMAEIDHSGAFTFVNPAAERILRRSKEQLLNLRFDAPVWGMTQPDGGPLSMNDIPAARALRGETVDAFELAISDPDNAARIVLEVNAVPKREDGGAITGALTSFVDITAQHKAERARAETERRFQAIAESMPQMIWSTLPDGFHDYYNSRWYEYTGVPKGSTDGEAWNGMFHPDDQERAWTRWRHSLATGEPYDIEYRLRHHTGEYRWVLGRALALRDGHGRIERWFGTCTDIHDLKAARDALEASEQRYRSLIEVSPQVVFFADPAGRVTYTNFYWHEYTGQSPDQALDAGWAAVLHPDHRERVLTDWRKATQDVIDFEIETPFQRADGGYRWFVARAVPVLDVQGNVEQWIGVAIDINDRKQAEEAQELLSRELSHRIKNIFALVIGLANLTGRNHPEAANYITALRARIQALAKAHDLVRPDQRGANMGDTGSLHDLIRALVAPYEKADGQRVTVAGDDIRISVKAATSLALIIHEQATNAAKYGALHTEDGTVSIVCQANGDEYRIVWQERGGPVVTAKPDRHGFGTVLAARTVISQLDGVVEHDWAPEGLTVSLAFPPARLSFG